MRNPSDALSSDWALGPPSPLSSGLEYILATWSFDNASLIRLSGVAVAAAVSQSLNHGDEASVELELELSSSKREVMAAWMKNNISADPSHRLLRQWTVVHMNLQCKFLHCHSTNELPLFKRTMIEAS